MSTFAILALAAGFLLGPAAPANEGVVEGRPLNHWVEVVRKGDTHPDWEKALRALESSREAAVPRLLPLLDDKDVSVRLRALFLLTYMPPLSEDVVAAFIKATRDPNPGYRMAALSGLGRPAVARKGVAAALLAAMKDPSHFNRATAARSLGNLGRDATPAIGALTAALADEKPIVREEAREALRKIRRE